MFIARNVRYPVALPLICFSGCALLTATPPSVEVADVQLIGVGLLEQQLEVTLCVTNPDASELSFRRVTPNSGVSGLPLIAGTSDPTGRSNADRQIVSGLTEGVVIINPDQTIA